MLTRCIVTLAQVTSQPALRIVRTIPNTPVKVRRGSVAVTFSEGCSGQDKEVVTTIFSRWVRTAVHCPAFVLYCMCSVGRCCELPERLQNSFAAMAGSGPAYIYQVRSRRHVASRCHVSRAGDRGAG